jgi:hypothetical protein
MKDNPVYAQLTEQMRTGSDEDLLADLTRFIGSFGDHDEECPGFDAAGRAAELAACACGFARRHDLLDELRRRLARPPSPRAEVR